MLLGSTIEDAERLTALLERAPLAGVLSCTLLALVVLFWLLIREKNSHMRTIREVVTLTQAISEHWERQLHDSQVQRLELVQLRGIVDALPCSSAGSPLPSSTPAPRSPP